jgi:hypothetical protein
LQDPPRLRGGIKISHLAYKITEGNRVWTAIRKGTGLVVDDRLNLSWGDNDDAIVTNVRSRGEKITRSADIYDQ